MKVVILSNPEEVSLYAAVYVAKNIKKYFFEKEEEKKKEDEKNKNNEANQAKENGNSDSSEDEEERIEKEKKRKKKCFVLGLPTGSTPLLMYNKLVEFHKNKLVSFSQVITFNMDEYVGINKNHPQSYYTYMHTNFFDKIDIKKENINILNGNVGGKEEEEKSKNNNNYIDTVLDKKYEEECEKYEKKIKKGGGIDLFVGGVGVNGHIAFNEPFSSLSSKTKKVRLTESTKEKNKKFFENENEMPTFALSVGIKTVFDANKILILATGKEKADAICSLVEGCVSHACPISALQLHPNVHLVVDEDAAQNLKHKNFVFFKNQNCFFHEIQEAANGTIDFLDVPF